MWIVDGFRDQEPLRSRRFVPPDFPAVGDRPLTELYCNQSNKDGLVKIYV